MNTQPTVVNLDERFSITFLNPECASGFEDILKSCSFKEIYLPEVGVSLGAEYLISSQFWHNMKIYYYQDYPQEAQYLESTEFTNYWDKNFLQIVRKRVQPVLTRIVTPELEDDGRLISLKSSLEFVDYQDNLPIPVLDQELRKFRDFVVNRIDEFPNDKIVSISSVSNRAYFLHPITFETLAKHFIAYSAEHQTWFSKQVRFLANQCK